MSTLNCGDNQGILRHYIEDESVDLIYLGQSFSSIVSGHSNQNR